MSRQASAGPRMNEREGKLVIRNPVIWGWDAVRGVAGTVPAGTIGSAGVPAIPRRIEIADLRAALAQGFEDFRANPTHYVFLCAIYPVLGLLLARNAVGAGLLPLIFPMVAGFTLLGPLVAVGLYEISRRRERGEPTSWWEALGVFQSPAIGSIIGVGLIMLALFGLWLAASAVLYAALLPAPQSGTEMLGLVFATPRGYALILLGCGMGFVFAVVALVIGTFSFPLMVDRATSAEAAIRTSVQAVLMNRRVMAIWGLLVAGALAAGSVPFLLGLAVVIPVLSHATWHLYRRVIA